MESKKTYSGFSKEQILKSKKYQKNRDVLSAILKDDERYSHKQIEEKLKSFFERKVK